MIFCPYKHTDWQKPTCCKNSTARTQQSHQPPKPGPLFRLVVGPQKTLRFFTNVAAMSPRSVLLLVTGFKCCCGEREPGATDGFFTFFGWTCLFVYCWLLFRYINWIRMVKMLQPPMLSKTFGFRATCLDKSLALQNADVSKFRAQEVAI